MYVTYVLRKKGLIDTTKPLIPTMECYFDTFEEAFKMKCDVIEEFWKEVGMEFSHVWEGARGRYLAVSNKAHESLMIEIQELK